MTWSQSFLSFSPPYNDPTFRLAAAGKRLQVDPNDPTFRQKRIFVSNLPPHVDWKLLKDYFVFEFGDRVVYASVSEDIRTGESKGCGLVQFETVDDAQRAIEMMNEKVFDGYTIRIREDKQTREGSTYKNNKIEKKGQVKKIEHDLDSMELHEEMEKKYSREVYIDKRFKERKQRLQSQPQSQSISRQSEKELMEIQASSLQQPRKMLPQEEFLSQPYDINEERSEAALRKISGLEARNEMVRVIQESINQREEARKRKDFEEADQIRSMLREKYKVQCDDKERSWRILAI